MVSGKVVGFTEDGGMVVEVGANQQRTLRPNQVSEPQILISSIRIDFLSMSYLCTQQHNTVVATFTCTIRQCFLGTQNAFSS